jgi:outer membrane protein assembly factor BamB
MLAVLSRFLPAILIAITFAAPLAAQDKGIGDFPKLSATTDWPWWRGPSRNGIAVGSAPLEFGDDKNVAWKTTVPGRGHSSPTVVKDRVYLATADEKDKVHSIVIFDRATGKQLEQIELNRGGFPTRNHAKNTEATPTIACDGERLFVSYYHHDQIELIALDLQGKPLWRKFCGKFHGKPYEYGYAPSPLIYQGHVIVVADFFGDSFLIAYDRATGAEAWRGERPQNISFSSPVIGHVAGKDQLLMSGGEEVISYDPKDGKKLWSARGTTHATCGTLVWDGDIVYASGGYPKSETVAVKADGSGEVLWKNNQKCYEQSMLATGGYLYCLTDQGIAFCWRGNDGQEMWKQRLKGPVSSSPVLTGGHIYQANELGTHYVFKLNPEKLEIVAENQVGSEAFATPSICGGQIFLRTAVREGGKRQEYLYCFGSK